MPRVGRFTIATIGDLHQQLRYVPEETALRQMSAAESLIGDIDPDQTYPQDFIIFRVTGYRPETADESLMLVGEALISDLVTLVQQLSRRLELTPDQEHRVAIPLVELARRLNVSRKSLQRYRRRGLVCHYVRFDDGVKRLACFEDALERYAERHHSELDRAAAFSRMARGAHDEIVDDARRLHDEHGGTLNEIALRLADSRGRAHETIRSILRRHERFAPQPIFGEPGPLSSRGIRVIHRAWRMGVPSSDIAARFRKSAPTVQRAVNARRRELLRTLTITHVTLPTFERADAADVILSSPAVRRELHVVPPFETVEVLLSRLHDASPVDENAEQAMLAAYNLLKRDAMERIADLPERPSADALDEVETRLRWATLVKRRLVCLALPAGVRAVEQHLHHALAAGSGEPVEALIAGTISVTAGAIETIDPSRGQRLERVCAHAVDLALARATDDAIARTPAGRELPVPAMRRLTPWQPLLAPRVDVLAAVGRFEEPMQAAVTMHYGLDGTPPMTCTAIASRLGVTPSAVSRWLRNAVRAARHRAP